MCFRKDQISTFKNLTCMCTVKSGGWGGEGKITAFGFLPSNSRCYLNNILQVPPGTPSEDEHCGPWVLKGCRAGSTLCPVVGTFQSVSPFCVPDLAQTKGVPEASR